MSKHATCPACGGAGMDLADGQCEVCSGEGIVELTEEFLDQNPDCCMGDDLEDDEDLPLDEEPGEAEK